MASFFDPWSDPWPVAMFQSKGRLNSYVCEGCGGCIITIDLVSGVTPFMTACRVTDGCAGMMRSRFYHVPDDYVATYEWYRPSREEIRGQRPEVREYVQAGGLLLRRIGAMK